MIDVAKNQYSLKPQRSQREDTGENVLTGLCAENRAVAAEQLAESGIQTGNTGDLLVHHPVTDLDADPHLVRFAASPPLHGLPRPQRFELRLEESEAPTKDSCGYFGATKKFTLSLFTKGQTTPHVLQRDHNLPASRGCVLGYRIHSVYRYRHNAIGAIVVILAMYVPGFEGQSLRYLAVTAQIDIRQ